MILMDGWKKEISYINAKLTDSVRVLEEIITDLDPKEIIDHLERKITFLDLIVNKMSLKDPNRSELEWLYEALLGSVRQLRGEPVWKEEDEMK